MKPTFFRLAAVTLAFGAALVAAWPGIPAAALAEDASSATATPGFDGATRWLNSPPLTAQGLHGKVVLVEFWTWDCINCAHVTPHVKALYERYAKDGLVVVGVHTPEFDEERAPAGVQAAIRRFGITWPVATDNGYRTWNAFGNRFWPAQYLIDREGNVVYRHVGEGNYEDTEARVRELLRKA